MKTFRHLILSFVAVLMTLPLAAQNGGLSESGKFKPRFSVGFDFTPEWCLSQKGSIDDSDPGNRFYPTFGVNFQAQLSRRDGVEVGVYYRGISQRLRERHDFVWRNRSVSARLLYRFYSRIFDVSAGFNADFNISSQKQSGGGAIIAYDDGRNLYGFVLRFSKDIPLYRGLILQPEIHVNPCIGDDGSGHDKITYRGTFLGCGVGLKYRF